MVVSTGEITAKLESVRPYDVEWRSNEPVQSSMTRAENSESRPSRPFPICCDEQSTSDLAEDESSKDLTLTQGDPRIVPGDSKVGEETLTVSGASIIISE